MKIPWNELKIANAIDEYIKNNFVISDEDDPKLNDIEYILNNKISNDFSIIQVYSSLFKEADIEYEVAISCNRYFLKFDPELFDPNQLREFLIFLPNQEKYISPIELNIEFLRLLKIYWETMEYLSIKTWIIILVKSHCLIKISVR